MHGGVESRMGYDHIHKKLGVQPPAVLVVTLIQRETEGCCVPM